MNAIIEFLKYLDESNIAYLLMLLMFFIMVGLYDGISKENTRLRKMLRNAVKGNGR